jgi:hypothetical protein
MFNQPDIGFSRIFTNSERIEFSDTKGNLLNIILKSDEVISLYDFRDRRVIVFGTDLGNISITEEQKTDKFSYFINYKKDNPIEQILPYRNLGERDMCFICGCNDDTDINISERINIFLQKLHEYLSVK